MSFDTIHVDHYGPIEKTGMKNKYLLVVVVGAFAKFIRLFPRKTTNTVELIKYMKAYFRSYSIPRRIILNRGLAFKSNTFKEFLGESHIELVLIATGIPRANGQVERMNRCVITILAKKAKALNIISGNNCLIKLSML